MMGQKVNPIGLRLGINRRWEAKWYTNNTDQFALYIKQDSLIRQYFKNLERALHIVQVVILRSNNNINIQVASIKPGLIIGKKGAEVSKHIVNLRRLLQEERVFLEAREVKRPYLSAAHVANEVAISLEKRMAYLPVLKRAVGQVMEAKALGVKIIVSGRLNGHDIARSESMVRGNVALHVFKNPIDYALKEAKTLFGIIGVKTYIHLPGKRHHD